MSKLENLLIKHEGLRLKPYKCPADKLTIGVGRNIEDNGITKDEAMYILRGDMATIAAELLHAFPWIDALSVTRQDALINMAFNLGMPRFKKFKKMLAALEIGDWQRSREEMLNSKWARQVGARASELAFMILRDQYLEG